jgi:hypothetical protein
MPDLLGASTFLRAASGLLHSSSWLTSWQPWPNYVAALALASWQPWPCFVAALALLRGSPGPYIVAARDLTLWQPVTLLRGSPGPYFVAALAFSSWQPRPLTCGSLDQTTHITLHCHRVLFFSVWKNPQQQAALPAACSRRRRPIGPWRPHDYPGS